MDRLERSKTAENTNFTSRLIEIIKNAHEKNVRRNFSIIEATTTRRRVTNSTTTKPICVNYPGQKICRSNERHGKFQKNRETPPKHFFPERSCDHEWGRSSPAIHTVID